MAVNKEKAKEAVTNVQVSWHAIQAQYHNLIANALNGSITSEHIHKVLDTFGPAYGALQELDTIVDQREYPKY